MDVASKFLGQTAHQIPNIGMKFNSEIIAYDPWFNKQNSLLPIFIYSFISVATNKNETLINHKQKLVIMKNFLGFIPLNNL